MGTFRRGPDSMSRPPPQEFQIDDDHQQHEQRLAAARRDLVQQADMGDYRDHLGHPLRNKFGLIEDQFADGRPFVMGDRYTVADPYLFVFERWLERDGLGRRSDYPKIAAHHDLVASGRPSKRPGRRRRRVGARAESLTSGSGSVSQVR